MRCSYAADICWDERRGGVHQPKEGTTAVLACRAWGWAGGRAHLVIFLQVTGGHLSGAQLYLLHAILGIYVQVLRG